MADSTRPPRRTRVTAKTTSVTTQSSSVTPTLSLLTPPMSPPVTSGASSLSPGRAPEDDTLAAAIARHPAGRNTWRDMNLAAVSHLPLPDIVGILTAAGYELRIQTRRSKTPR